MNMGHPEGESMRMGFDGGIKLEFHGAKVTSDGGLLAYRELDDALGLFDAVSTALSDQRTGRNIQHAMPTLLRQSIYSRLAGYEDVNDAERLSVDPVMRALTGKRSPNKQAASVNTMGRFETEFLTQRENLAGLSEINGKWVERAMSKTPHRRIILDLDSSESPVHGAQEGSAYNGHFGSTCIRCSASISSGIVKASCCALVMFTALIVGRKFWNRSSRDTRTKRIGNTFVAMRPSPNQRSMNTWRETVSCMPSGCLPTSSSMNRYDPC